MAQESMLNLTPHDIVVVDGWSPKVTYPRSGEQVRLNIVERGPPTQLENGVWVHEAQRFTTLDRSMKFDEKIRGVLVSMPVGEHLRTYGKKMGIEVSVYGPDTSPDAAVRDGDGRIVGTKALVLYYDPHRCTECNQSLVSD